MARSARTRQSHELRPVAALTAIAVAAMLLMVARAADHFGVASAQGTFWLFEGVILLLASLGLFVLRREARRRQALLEQISTLSGNEQQAMLMARQDPLTQLLNRRALEQLETADMPEGLERAALICDLDQFKLINDRHGHPFGDAVLREFADRMRALLLDHGEQQLFRMGGDEFAIIIDAPSAGLAADALAEALLDAMRQPMAIGDIVSTIDVSIGAARVERGEDLATALSRADTAMYEAKRSGSRYLMFDPEADAAGRLATAQAVRMLERRAGESLAAGDRIFVGAFGVDRFAVLRRAAGPHFGGQLIRAIRERIEGDATDVIVDRLAPDVFGVAFPARDDIAALERLQRVRAVAEGTTLGRDTGVDLSFTIGMAGPGPITMLRELSEQAHVALEEARESGRRHCAFGEASRLGATSNLDLMRELREAIAANALELHYQPKLDARAGTIDSYEALVRWSHPVRGDMPPASFIPVAEQTGNIRQLTSWILKRVIADHKIFKDAGVGRNIFINVSAQLIGDTDFAEELVAALGPMGGAIGIEITETAVMTHPERALAHLSALAETGVRIAIDDYGAGMSSLVYLKQMPAHELKIDMIFIAELTRSHRDPLIVRSTIDLAHGLGMRVTAEGVDRADTQALLEIMGCDLLQGYQIARPMTPGELVRFMTERTTQEATAEPRRRSVESLLHFRRG